MRVDYDERKMDRLGSENLQRENIAFGETKKNKINGCLWRLKNFVIFFLLQSSCIFLHPNKFHGA